MAKKDPMDAEGSRLNDRPRRTHRRLPAPTALRRWLRTIGAAARFRPSRRTSAWALLLVSPAAAASDFGALALIVLGAYAAVFAVTYFIAWRVAARSDDAHLRLLLHAIVLGVFLAPVAIGRGFGPAALALLLGKDAGPALASIVVSIVLIWVVAIAWHDKVTPDLQRLKRERHEREQRGEREP